MKRRPFAWNGSARVKNSRSSRSTKRSARRPSTRICCALRMCSSRAAIDFDIDGGRLLAFEAEQHGLVAAVTLARRAQRAVQLDAQPLDPVEDAVVLETQREQPRRPHRSDRMRARRTDADLEEIKDADGHVQFPCAASHPSRRPARRRASTSAQLHAPRGATDRRPAAGEATSGRHAPQRHPYR